MNELRTAYLSLGANLGRRRETLREAVKRIGEAAGVELTAVSSVYETEPWGKLDQPRFLNLAVAIKTTLTPETLLALTQSIETALGRVRHERWGPRTIDIDILWFEGVERNTPKLTLPHPRMTERAFVLVPLAEIAPALTIEGKTAEEWQDLTGSEGVIRVAGIEQDETKNEPQPLR
ncbi:MAG: 2-amino-4-hydroxy-6-hydroxymethyldihydropteridine diphosphokinase [Schwartzia sp.]|nr:2-amino-4-hydroxy-6-hydroxymethyldihydropteridine diphosphokinase [Schwartzia sp. (in: firmicutes)]